MTPMTPIRASIVGPSEFPDAPVLFLGQRPEILAMSAILPNRIIQLRPILVPLDRRVDRIDCGRGRQGSRGDRGGNNAAGCNS
jgi:hypothetical protein